LILSIVLSLLLTTLTGLGPSLERERVGLHPGFAKIAQVYGVYTFTSLLLLGTLITLLRASARQPSASFSQRDVPLTEPVPPPAAA
jgi:hypothetical protein